MAQDRTAPAKFSHRDGQSDRMGRRKTTERVPADFDRKCFEFDRELVEIVIEKLRRALGRTADQMATMSREQMFRASLAASFSRTERRLNKMIGNLDMLLGEVQAATGYPSPEDPDSACDGTIQPLPVQK